MAVCNTITSLFKSCDPNNVGGIFEVYINDQDNVSSYSADTSSTGATAWTIQTLTLATGATKYATFQFKRNIGNFKVEKAVNLENGSTIHKVTLSLKFLRRDGLKSRQISVLSEGQRYLSIIVKGADGQFTYFENAQINGGNEDSGTKKEDGSTYELSFYSEMDNSPFFVSPAIVPALLA